MENPLPKLLDDAPNGSSLKLVHFPHMNNDTSPLKEEISATTAPKKYHRAFSDVFPFWRSRRNERPLLVKSDSESAPRKTPLKPIIHRSGPGRMQGSVEAEPYRWPHDGSLDPKSTALVIIDMQKDFCSPEGYLQHQGYDITPVRAIIPRLQTLLTAFRAHNFPIYHTREGHRPDLSTLSARELHRSTNNASGLGIGSTGPLGRLLIRGEPGHDIIPELYPLPGENVIDKPGRSAFQHTEFGLMLSIKGVRNLVICGVTTDVCVLSTMRDANDNNFDCVLMEDATAASEIALHEAAVQSVKMEGGIFGAVSSVEKILAAVEGRRDEVGSQAKPGKLVVSTDKPFVFP